MTGDTSTRWGTGDLAPAEKETGSQPKRAVLVGVTFGQKRSETEASLRELSALAKALGLVPAATLLQDTDNITQKTLIGSGKVKELLLVVEECKADLVIFNDPLTPMQVRHLEDALDTEVLDRTGIILQIFSERARTREARLQVASARLSYLLPRLAGMRKNLSRQGGGSGRLSNKGAGEEQLELDRRHIERELSEIRRQLKDIDKERSTQRAMRLRSGLPRVSLVGYTNAGKSTLMNALLARSQQAGRQEKQVFEQDMLFATLDTQVRRIEIPGHTPFLLSDTVGFLSDLPHTLVQAFRSTLEEAKYADLLLAVEDCSDPSKERQEEVTRTTLQEIGAGDIQVLSVCNKADLLEEAPLGRTVGDRVYLSAKSGEGLEALLCEIDTILAGQRIPRRYLVPYSRGKLLADLSARHPEAVPVYREEGAELFLTLPRREAEVLSLEEGVTTLPDKAEEPAEKEKG